MELDSNTKESNVCAPEGMSVVEEHFDGCYVPTLLFDSVAEVGFYSQHRPLALRKNSHSNDPVFSLTNQTSGSIATPFASIATSKSIGLVDSQNSDKNWIDMSESSINNFEWYHDEYAKLFNAFVPFAPPTAPQPAMDMNHPSVYMNEEGLLEKFFESFDNEQQSVLASHSLNTTPSKKLHLLNIIKIRRKKMNKHKWKKHRRMFRDSSRYNKAKLKRKGETRKKQE